MFIARKKCPICSEKKLFKKKVDIHKNEAIYLLQKYYKKKISLGIFKNYIYKILKCSRCELEFQEFICNKKLSYHLYENIINKKESLNKKTKLNFIGFNNYLKEIELISKIFKKDSNKIKILEFGCGWGFWSRLAQSFNFDVRTIEISKSRIKFFQKYGIKNLKKLKKRDKFDFIYSNQVFEHLSHPKIEFLNLISHLNKQGYLFIKVPSPFMMNIKKIFKKYPHENILFPLEHINLYKKKTFEFLANKYKLKICNYKILKIGGIFSIILYVKNFLTSSFVLFQKQ